MLDNDVLHHGMKLKFLVFTNERECEWEREKGGLIVRNTIKNSLKFSWIYLYDVPSTKTIDVPKLGLGGNKRVEKQFKR